MVLPESGGGQREAAHLLRLRVPTMCQQWIKRRVDTIEFADQSTILRIVKLDLDLTNPRVEALLVRRSGFFLLPIARLSWDKSTSIEVQDETGAVLSRLNVHEERALALHALRGVAHAALGQPPQSDTLQRIAEVLGRSRRPENFDNDLGGEISHLAQSVGFMGLLYILHLNYYLVVLRDYSGC